MVKIVVYSRYCLNNRCVGSLVLTIQYPYRINAIVINLLLAFPMTEHFYNKSPTRISHGRKNV